MSARRTWLLTGGCAVVLVFPLGASAVFPDGGRSRREALVLYGSVKGLYPGAQARLRVRLRNRARYDVSVESITTAPSSARPGCSAGNLRIGRFRGHVLVPRGRSRVVTLRVLMLRAAPDACRSAAFRFHFRAYGVRR